MFGDNSTSAVTKGDSAFKASEFRLLTLVKSRVDKPLIAGNDLFQQCRSA